MNDKQAQKEMRVKYQADLIVYQLTVLERLAKGTKYEPATKQALKLIMEIK